jgi:hypothetical protein
MGNPSFYQLRSSSSLNFHSWSAPWRTGYKTLFLGKEQGARAQFLFQDRLLFAQYEDDCALFWKVGTVDSGNKELRRWLEF